MPRKATTVQAGKRQIELSNLSKVLFPDAHITKAELIEYYLKIAPTLLGHIRGRPLSLVRFPDGISGERFYQKNRPDWAPRWIEHVTLGEEEKVDYIVATEEASLVWLANLACVEIHQIHARTPHCDKPDYIVFDLDPPEGYPFGQTVEIAFRLKEHIEGFGYHPFVKTTGGKGLHLLTPIEPKWRFDQAYEAAAQIARPFVDAHGDSTTLHIQKEARRGKLLVDIYRNRSHQSIVSPYSVRGRPLAPVSMPLAWEELRSLRDPVELNLRTALEHVLREGDAWEAMAAYSVRIHTEKKPAATSKKPAEPQRRAASGALKTYAAKRDFQRTSEPPPQMATETGSLFVIHRHHATRLHYDLRLEREGVLKSWAVPKGLPPRPGIKRLAVSVEDHPLSYGNFEGIIPKGEYGAGPVWIFARGKYETTKEKKDGFYIRLQSREINAEFRLIHTREKDWLLERVDAPQVDWIHAPVEPMLAEDRDRPPASPNYFYEVKWDGIRALVALDEGQLTIRSRSQRDITHQFPELLIPEQAFRATCGLFDGEIVCLDPQGKPVFEHVLHRLQQSGQGAIDRARTKHPAVCYLFDCLYLDGRPIVNEPLTRRRAWLQDAVRQNPVYRASEALAEGQELYEAAAKMGLEGIIAKERNSSYLPGKRSSSWLKIKARRTAEFVILGYTKGKGSRQGTFGALLLGQDRNGRIRYAGRVGTGFDDRTQQALMKLLQTIRTTKRPVEERVPDEADAVWLEPRLYCEVRYASLTEDGSPREPVFLRLRPDLEP